MENNVLTNNTKALSIIKWTARKYLALSIAYWIMLFITLPLIEIFAMIVLASNGEMSLYSSIIAESHGLVTVAGGIAGAFFSGVAIIFSAIIALITFSYLHNKRIIDFFGSMPVSRRTMFFARYIYVLAASVIPVIVFGLIGMILTFNATAMFSILKTIGFIVLGIVGNVSVIAFISVCCGNIADVIVTYAVINIIWPICVFICNNFPISVIPGLEPGYLWSSIFTLFCPVAAVFTGIFGDGQILHILWWSGLSIVLVLGCSKLSKKRKAEMAQNTYYFTAVEVVIKFITCFASGFCFGWIMSHLQGNDQSVKYQYIWFFVGVVIGVMIANILLHLIFHRGLSKYKNSLPECGIVSVVVIGFLFVVTTGGFGYDSRVPDAGDVEKVLIQQESGESFYVNGEDCLALNSKDSTIIKTAVQYHSDIVKEKAKKKNGVYPIFSYDYSNGDEGFRIQYSLKDGSLMNRSYGYTTVEKAKELKDKTHIKIRGINNIPIKYLDAVYLGDKNYDRIDGWNSETDNGFTTNRKEVIEKGGLLVEAVKKDIAENGLIKSDRKAKYILELYYESGAPKYSYFSTELYISKDYKHTLKVINELIGKVNKGYNYLSESPIFASYSEKMINAPIVREVYFKVPGNWNKNKEISCMLINSKLVDEGEDEDGEYTSVEGTREGKPALFTELETEFSQCKKVSDNVWKYSIRDISEYSEDFNRVMFYQKDGSKLHFTGGIALRDNKAENLLITTDYTDEAIDAVFAGPRCEYKWKNYSE